MGNTQTQTEYLAKLKKQFKLSLDQKRYVDARSFLLRIERFDDEPRRRGQGNINSWLPKNNRTTANRAERRKNKQREVPKPTEELKTS